MKIDKPACDWVAMAFKNRSLGFYWLCRSCGARGKGKITPACPCTQIIIGNDPQDREPETRHERN
jgi:hypothetical protein